MHINLDPLRLGASLYIPATHGDLFSIANGEKHPQLRSMIFCTEDAVLESDLGYALGHLNECLPHMTSTSALRFVRVRNPLVLRELLEMEGIMRLDGFVFPKITQHNLESYYALLGDDNHFQIMLTLETCEVFDQSEMLALRNLLLQDHIRSRLLSLRIGGNDLLNLLGIRRPRERTIYDTPLGAVIASLVTTFRPSEFNLTAPVYEHFCDHALLREEIERDLANGLFGKSAVHPEQVAIIEECYRVKKSDLEMAEALCAQGSRSIFKLHDSMCEQATHSRWAVITLERAKLYGVT